MDKEKQKKLWKFIKEPAFPAWGAVIVASIALFKVSEIIEVKPQINNVIENITKVEKEIANINEAIHQQYSAFEMELFTEKDLSKTVFVCPNPYNPKRDSLIFLVLKKPPEFNSLLIANSTGTYTPPGSYQIDSNIIQIWRQGVVSDDVFKASSVYAVKYVPDVISHQKILSIKGVEASVDKGQLKIILKS